MKILGVLFLFTFTGCSTYSIMDYPSKQAYISEINSNINKKKINITLRNDSVITVKDGGVITNDTLLLKDKTIPLTEINKISYKTYPITSCLLGAGTGFAGATLAGAIVQSFFHDNKEKSGRKEAIVLVSAIAGFVAGSLTGGFMGWENIYLMDFWK